MAATLTLLRRVARRRSVACRWHSGRSVSVALRASSSQAKQAALEQTVAPEEEDLRAIFKEASGGKDTVTIDQCLALEGIEGVLEEGATDLKELAFMWGDVEVPLDFEGFSTWYCEVLRIYDEFLWKDAIAPPDEVLEDDRGGDEDREYTDTELFEDAPATNQDIRGMKTKPGTASGKVVDKQPGRQNVEITRLFREGGDEDNLLSFDAFLDISEIKELVKDGEVTKDELQGFWDTLPNKESMIDILAFRDLLVKVDALFEYVEEDEEGQEEVGEEVDDTEEGDDDPDEDDEEAPQAPPRDPEIVREELFELIKELSDNEKKACGLGGSDSTDPTVVKLTNEMERWFRNTVDVEVFDTKLLCGDWELIYSTSPKFRRWGSILNQGKYISNGQMDGLIQNFTIVSGYSNEYDMEEAFVNPEGREFGMRGTGSWSVTLQNNVISGMEDLVLKLAIMGVDFDDEDDKIMPAELKVIDSQMVRTYAYNFIAYVDEEVRIMRSDLTGLSTFIYRKLPEEDPLGLLAQASEKRQLKDAQKRSQLKA